MIRYYKWQEDDGTGTMEIDLPTEEKHADFFDDILTEIAPNAVGIEKAEYNRLIKAKKRLEIL